jgi:hypothetical protein
MGRGCRYPASDQGRNAAVRRWAEWNAHGWDTWEEPRVPSKAEKDDGLQLGMKRGQRYPAICPGRKAAIKEGANGSWLGTWSKTRGYPVR